MKKLVAVIGIAVLFVTGCTVTEETDQQADQVVTDTVNEAGGSDTMTTGEQITAEDEALYTDVAGDEIVAAHEEEDLSSEEEDALVQLREEEKLARDVYLTLAEYWDWRTFENIAQSEQTHMDAVLSLLERYEIPDPSETMEVGEFESVELQGLYNQLIDQGKESLLEAFRIGVLIEDLDIYDIQQFQQQADNADVLQLFANLKLGSENHMRAFNRQLEKLGGSYDATYLSQVEIDQILN